MLATEKSITLFTIGFTQKNAREFFGRLKTAGVRKLIDIRLNNVSQLAGYTKKDDLAFFLLEIGNIDYVHRPELAPTKEILDAYKKGEIDWNSYEQRYVALLDERGVEQRILAADLDHACLLCSEATADKCHRRLAAEYLNKHRGNISIKHL